MELQWEFKGNRKNIITKGNLFSTNTKRKRKTKRNNKIDGILCVWCVVIWQYSYWWALNIEIKSIQLVSWNKTNGEKEKRTKSMYAHAHTSTEDCQNAE